MTEHKGRRRFHLTIELLEDLHTGCGTGSGIIDRTLARDASGRPIVPGSHLRGVWRDVGERLLLLGRINETQWRGLFGAAGGERGSLTVGDLVAHAPRTLTWDATARKKGDRAPDDHSLRRTEYLAAGTCLTGASWLETDDADLSDAFDRILRACDHLGSERSRGCGLIRLRGCDWGLESYPADAGLRPALPLDITRLRLLLRAEAPLCIPTTGYPGNIVPGETHIPGRMLYGALCAWSIARGRKPTGLFDHLVRVGPAYPLPEGHGPKDSAALAALQLLPMPLHLYTPKPTEQPLSNWPHWAPGRASVDSADKSAPDSFKDMLAGDVDVEVEPAELHKIRYKRPKPNAYLYRSAASDWSAFLAPVGLRMRNRRGTSLKEISATEADLFTTELVPAGTELVADLEADRGDDLAGLLTDLSGLVGEGTGPGSAILRIGRGGAPVSVIGWCAPDRPVQETAPPDGLRITLTSDLIARSPGNLGFHQRLGAGALCDLLGLDPPDPDPDPDRDGERQFSDALRYSGFNATSGLPAVTRLAIRRGSTFQVRGPLAGRLRAALTGVGALGGRRWEGCGRFVLDLAPDPGGIRWLHRQFPAGDQQRVAGKAIRAREGLVEAAEGFQRTLEDNKVRLTRSQLGNLRDLVANLPSGAGSGELREAFEEFAKRARTRRDKQTWIQVFDTFGLIGRLAEHCAAGSVADHADLFLRLLQRHARKETSDDV